MIEKVLSGVLPAKFILIQDNVEIKAKQLLNYILYTNARNPRTEIYYMASERIFPKTKSILQQHSNIKLINLTSDVIGWTDTSEIGDLKKIVQQINKNGAILIFDSLSYLVLKYGVNGIYKWFNELITNKQGVQQIVAVLHTDVIETEYISQYFSHLSTLSVNLEPPYKNESNRLLFIYKKSTSKVIKERKQYKFDNDNLVISSIKSVDPKTLVLQNLQQVQPENLTTFKIGLNEAEKLQRSQLVLPYLPQEIAEKEESVESKVIYQFDNFDDWDEEDPDDDLDI